MTMYSSGIGASPGIPITDNSEEMIISTRIAIKRGLLGFDFQKLSSLSYHKNCE